MILRTELNATCHTPTYRTLQGTSKAHELELPKRDKVTAYRA